MNISISKASKEWGISRTTLYKKIDEGELSRTADKKIDISEMLRVFGEPPKAEQHNNVLNKTVNTVQKTPVDTSSEQLKILQLQHKLELEHLKNEHLEQQVKDQKNLIEDYQQQIKQLNMSLAQATSSINEFAQTRLLELKYSQIKPEPQDKNEAQKDNSKSGEVGVAKNYKEYSQQVEKEDIALTTKTKQKNKWWSW